MAARYKSSHEYFEKYFYYFSNFQLGSIFLNGGSNKQVGANTKFYDEQNLKNELVHYVGNDERGLFKKDGVDMLALVPSATSELNDLEQNFARYQQKQKNLGFEVTEYSSNVLDRKLKLEALIDVMTMEVAFIQKKLDSFVAVVEVADDSKVLAWGLCGHVKQIGGRPHLIDGQLVEMRDGVNYISDSRSPYNNLSLIQYRSLCTLWREEQKRKQKKQLLIAQAECRERGIPIVQHIGATSFKRVSKSNLPPIPDDFVIVKKKTLTRTK